MQVSNPGRVAFIFFPHRPETIPLDTMPFAAHVIKQLAAAHCQIDVFCFNSSNSSYPDDLWAPPLEVGTHDAVRRCQDNENVGLYLKLYCPPGA